jgi:2,3-bisphosphoglycerate-dependent phosphoglycerate mutase
MNYRNVHWKLFTFVTIGMALLLAESTAAVLAQEQQQDPAGGTTWLIFRHAEREGRSDQLSDAGRKRANVLQQLGTAFRVAAVYSTDFNRTRDTVAPMAQALDLTIETYPVQGHDWLTQVEQKHRGKVIAIVGHSNTTGEMVEALTGIKPRPIEHDHYDRFFLVRTGGQKPTVMEIPYGSSAADKAGMKLDSRHMAPVPAKSGGE